MSERMTKDKFFSSEYRASIQEAHDNATRTALLEHARMGRSVPQSGPDGKGVVWITPVEIFALYGLDEFGREKV